MLHKLWNTCDRYCSSCEHGRNATVRGPVTYSNRALRLKV